MKKIIVLTLALLFAIAPCCANAVRRDGCTVLDFDGSDGYSGDYVLIYNPNVTGGTLETGDLTDITDDHVNQVYPRNTRSIVNTIEDDMRDNATYLPVPTTETVIGEIDREEVFERYQNREYRAKTNEYEIGDVVVFYNHDAELSQFTNMEFKLVGKSEHSYVWETTDEADYPLSLGSDTAAAEIAVEFESKFELMRESFGDFSDPQGHGRVNLLFYDIGKTSVAGFFSADCLSVTGCAAINIDTYPSIMNEDGTFKKDNIAVEVGNTIVHEFQHCINQSRTGGSAVWINEMMSAAAEEICYPGSSTVLRIVSWQGGNTSLLWYGSGANEYFVTRYETKATAKAHMGGAKFYDFQMNSEAFYSYARISLFSQYLYTRTGNTIYSKILDNMEQGKIDRVAIELALSEWFGADIEISNFIRDFYVATVANDSISYDGTVGFETQDGYVSSDNYNIYNPYDLLGPIIYYEGDSLKIKSGAFAVVKTIDGIFNPPADAEEGLVYVGIRSAGSKVNNREIAIGDANCDGKINTGDAVCILKNAVGTYEFAIMQREKADMTGDGNINTGDAVAILKYTVS